MKRFSCLHCGGRLYFENAQCLNCGSPVLYDPDAGAFVLSGQRAPACTNATECGCNWTAEPESGFCRACALNKTILDMSISGNRERWIRVAPKWTRAAAPCSATSATELGHYYWDRLVRDDPARLERFHTLFGHESADFDDALRRHYAEGAAPEAIREKRSRFSVPNCDNPKRMTRRSGPFY